MQRAGTLAKRAVQNAGLIAEEVDRIAFAKCFTAAIRGVNLHGLTAACCEDWSNRPTTEHVAQEARLVSIERRLVDEEDVVDELAIKWLNAIHRRYIEGIIGRVLARCLVHRAGSERLRPREVLLHRQSVPLVHAQSEKSSVVISIPNTGVDANTRSQLTVSPARRRIWRSGTRCASG